MMYSPRMAVNPFSFSYRPGMVKIARAQDSEMPVVWINLTFALFFMENQGSLLDTNRFGTNLYWLEG